MTSRDSANATTLCCPQCGYSLAGLPDDHQCPECGFGYQVAAIESLARSDAYARLNFAEGLLWFSVAALLVIANAIVISDTSSRPRSIIVGLIPIIVPGAAWLYRHYTDYEFDFSVARIWMIRLGWPLMVAALLVAPFASLVVALGLAIFALILQHSHRPRFPYLDRSVPSDLAAEVAKIRRAGLVVFVVAIIASLFVITRR